MTAGLEPALVAMRLVQFASAMVLLGAPSFALGLAIVCPNAVAVRRDFDRWLWRCLGIAALAALVSAALWLDIEAGVMGDGWDRMIDPDTIAAVLLDTVFGRAWCWHLAIEGALLGILAVTPGRVMHASVTALVVALGVVHAASLAWAGHAVMHPGLWHVLVQVIHLLAGALWLGSLPALFHLATLARRQGASEAQDVLWHMLPLYSRAGYAAVGAMLLTGLLNSWFLVGSIAALSSTPFGRVLLAKIILVLLMIGVAAGNRFVLQPKIMTAGGDGAVPMGKLWRSVALEQIIGGLVLAAVSVLGTLPPAMAH